MKKFAIFLGFLFLTTMTFANTWQEKINPEILAELQAGATLDLIILFHEQADLSAAATIKGKTEKAQYVFGQVQQIASRTQATAIQILEETEQPFRTFSVVNAINAQLDYNTARRIASLEGVKNIQPNPWSFFEEPIYDHGNANDRGVLEWGIEKINASAVWDLGFQGQGVVIGGQDTGYEWFHPTLQEKYRGWNGENTSHDYHWHDAIHEISPLHNDTIIAPENNPCGLDSTVPCDDHNHGTYTMGTMVGDDGDGNQIGVAPQAQWIGCRSMERGWGKPSTYIECFEWFLAPTDLDNENPDPLMAPHVINNSWGCPPVEGCEPANFELMEIALNSLRASGVVVVVSAGNSGSNCNSIDDPSAIFEGAFSIGAFAINDTIAGFSSRGAVAIDSSFRLKPNISAPGVSIRSARRNGGFQTSSGTSAASPHVAGTVALMISAAPHLAGEVDTLEAIMELTAIPMLSEQDCDGFSGMEVPNAVYGYGRLDALSAVTAAMEVEIVAVDDMVENMVAIFPNPADDVFYISGWPVEQEGEVLLFNAQGQMVLQQAVTASVEEISIKELPAGTYWYVVKGDRLFESGKLVVIE